MPSIDDLRVAGFLLSMIDMELVDQRQDEEFDNLNVAFRSSES
jgi:hypothetical protein